MKEATGLIGDIAVVFGRFLTELFTNNNTLNNLVNIMLNEPDEEANSIGQFVITEVTKIL